jgi:hypothetical protein
VMASEEVIKQRRTGAADVQIAGRAWRETSADLSHAVS